MNASGTPLSHGEGRLQTLPTECLQRRGASLQSLKTREPVSPAREQHTGSLTGRQLLVPRDAVDKAATPYDQHTASLQGRHGGGGSSDS